jgi:hypothetical protein
MFIGVWARGSQQGKLPELALGIINNSCALFLPYLMAFYFSSTT